MDYFKNKQWSASPFLVELLADVPGFWVCDGRPVLATAGAGCGAWHFHKWATTAPEVAFAWLHRAHWVLLALSLITIFGAVAGSQGWSVF